MERCAPQVFCFGDACAGWFGVRIRRFKRKFQTSKNNFFSENSRSKENASCSCSPSISNLGFPIMLCVRSVPFLLIIIISAFFLSSSHGVVVNGVVSQSSKGLIGEEEYGLVEKRRFIAEEQGSVDSSSLILAAKRTHRKDPLDSFKRYTRGWNISEEHYWASVGFSAAPFFVIASVWFVVFGLTLSLICFCYYCCPRAPYGYSRTAYALSLMLLVLFTVAAIVGCVVLYTGQGKFDKSTEKTLDYIVAQANKMVDDLRSVSDYLAAAQKIGVARSLLAPDIQTRIDAIQLKINSSATTLAAETEKNSDRIQDVLHKVRLSLIIIAAVMLLLTFVGFLFSILGMQSLACILVIIGWILVAGTFILCGVFLLLSNVVADTCVAMDQWVHHPTAHTALDDILPCVDSATATETLLRSKQVSSQLVDVVNKVITNLSNINVPPGVGPPLFYNQSGPLIPLLCNPFNKDMADRTCAAGKVDLSNATQAWKNYVCEVSSAGVCTTVGRLTPDYYTQMSAAVNVSFGLYHYGPRLVQLEDCTFVRDTFRDITVEHCPGLKQYVKLVYTGLVMVSGAVMLSLIFWVIYARERRHRVYTEHLLQGYGRGVLMKARGPKRAHHFK